VAEIEPVVQPDSVGNDIWRDIGGVYMFSFADSTSYGFLTWQYPQNDFPSLRLPKSDKVLGHMCPDNYEKQLIEIKEAA
jgi:hypothetical protein